MEPPISDFTILNLEAIGILLTGYGYVLSQRIKTKVDAVTETFLQAQHDLSCRQLVEMKPRRGLIKTYVLTTFAFLSASLVFGVGGWLLTAATRNVWVLIVTVLTSFFFISGMLQGIIKLTEVWLGPRAGLALFIGFSRILLQNSKGVIATIGFLFLVAALVCRYINWIH